MRVAWVGTRLWAMTSSAKVWPCLSAGGASSPTIRISFELPAHWRSCSSAGSSTSTGTPWAIVGSVSSVNQYTYVTLYPTPDGSYTIRIAYRKEPTALVTSPADNYTDYSDAWDEVICYGAADSCALRLGDYQRSQALNQRYKELIASIYPAQIKATQQVTKLKAPWGIRA